MREQLPMPRNELADYAANKSDRDSKLGTISRETGQGTISIKLDLFASQKKKISRDDYVMLRDIYYTVLNRLHGASTLKKIFRRLVPTV